MRLFLGSFATIPNYRKIKEDFSFLQGKWVEKQNLHLTYLFLGEQPSAAPIIDKLRDIDTPKHSIPLEGVGFFGHPPKVLYTHAKSEAIELLYKEICERLKIESDKPFIPHVTLCRIKKIGDFSRFTEKIKRYDNEELGSIKPTLCLVQSILGPKGPLYKVLERF